MFKNPDSVREAVRAFKPYAPGLSIDEIAEKYGLSRVIKMASNENPLGMSPLAVEAIQRAAAEGFRYAQSGNPRLARAVAEYHGVDVSQVVLGNGSDEVIDLLVRCRAEAGRDNIVVNRPCFSLYPMQTKLCGVELREVPLNADFSFNWQGLLEQTDGNTALVFITTPDNPTGYCPPVAEVEDFAKNIAAKAPGALLVVDEAYMDLSGDEKAHSLLPKLNSFPNVAILRTFSKSFGLAGLRIGYGIMPANLADYLCRVRLPFSVNLMAEAAGIAALQDKEFLRLTKETVASGRVVLSDGLHALGCRPVPSQANFLIFRLPEDCKLDTEQVFTALLERGVIIRQVKSYGLPDYLRVSVGNPDENRVFLKELAEILN
ncbi:histidinol-phosphate transaminase [Desulfovibrio sp. OttesenSCG-928-C06]|nr:histidinol-phosphate transaminase [Desulfovibrio sp. OttesenSCG-928-C06]